MYLYMSPRIHERRKSDEELKSAVFVIRALPQRGLDFKVLTSAQERPKSAPGALQEQVKSRWDAFSAIFEYHHEFCANRSNRHDRFCFKTPRRGPQDVIKGTQSVQERAWRRLGELMRAS